MYFLHTKSAVYTLTDSEYRNILSLPVEKNIINRNLTVKSGKKIIFFEKYYCNKL